MLPADIIKRYLIRQPGADMTTAELWKFYAEISASGELDPMTRQQFQRVLPGAMAAVFGANKCHSIQRGTQSLRGFKSVTINEHAIPVTTLELELTLPRDETGLVGSWELAVPVEGPVSYSGEHVKIDWTIAAEAGGRLLAELPIWIKPPRR